MYFSNLSESTPGFEPTTPAVTDSHRTVTATLSAQNVAAGDLTAGRVHTIWQSFIEPNVSVTGQTIRILSVTFTNVS